jgi:hypothetical protein
MSQRFGLDPNKFFWVGARAALTVSTEIKYKSSMTDVPFESYKLLKV